MKLRLTLLLPGLLLVLALGPAAAWPEEERQAARREMVANQIEARGVADPAVLAAMLRVPRHKFVPEYLVEMAYDDRPLPIGYGQTISQPYIVAYMTEILRLTGREKVLEIGTGSGYQAAILAETAREVHSIEIIPELAEQAQKILGELGYGRVQVSTGDGYHGRPEAAPFDAVIVTCAADHVPPPLIAQLTPGGRMVIPVGPAGAIQNLLLIERTMDGRIERRPLMPVRFVPLVRHSSDN